MPSIGKFYFKLLWSLWTFFLSYASDIAGEGKIFYVLSYDVVFESRLEITLVIHTEILGEKTMDN